jgi:hypothetical protein
MRRIWIIAPLVLGIGCNTPSLGFYGVEPSVITVDGSTFDVRIKDLKAEAIRTNAQYAPRLGPIGERAAAAIEKVSGCTVSRYSGDQAVIVATLRCGENGPVSYAQPSYFDCSSTRGIALNGGTADGLDLNCVEVRSDWHQKAK